MIPKDNITAWRAHAPWQLDAQVEQDLVISRAIVDLFSVPELASSLIFRGGTALYKIYFAPVRYSEDIDLVQVRAEPIGETLDLARSVLDPWLGEPRRQLKEGRVNLVYRFESEGPPVVRLRLKVETNTREHYTEHGHVTFPFAVESKWFKGHADVTTFTLEELIGTKLRALYQRKKGRDLFDIWTALVQDNVSPDRVLDCFHRCMREGGHSASRAQLEENLAAKRNDPRFVSDIEPLLRPGTDWDLDIAMGAVLDNLVALLPGDPWKGEDQPAQK
jgi:predicted nucleotidyltransferase component of viral defense system